jgi:hypothetical protein
VPPAIRRRSAADFAYLALAVGAMVVIALSAARIAGSALFDDQPRMAFATGRGLCAPGQSYAVCHPSAGPFRPDKTRLSQCRGEPACYQQAFGNLAFARGPRVALRRFDAAIRTNPVVTAHCHPMAHVIGSASLARAHGDVARAFAQGSASCWSGYYHGILERAFAQRKPDEDVSDVARSLCAKRNEWTVFLAYQCVHGLGHGLMITLGYDLPGALRVCDHLTTEWDRSSCAGGAFMENIVASSIVRSPWLKTDDPLFPCQRVAERHRLSCYLVATSWINRLNGFNWQQTARTCRSAPTRWIPACFQSMGRDASGYTVQNADRVVTICRRDRAYWQDCVAGATRDFAANFSSGPRAATLCKLIPAYAQPRCYYEIGTIVGAMRAAPAARGAECARTTIARLADCLRGASAVRLKT